MLLSMLPAPLSGWLPDPLCGALRFPHPGLLHDFGLPKVLGQVADAAGVETPSAMSLASAGEPTSPVRRLLR